MPQFQRKQPQFNRRIIEIRKQITSPLIIKELELMEQETEEGFSVIAYRIIVEKVYQRIREREMCSCIVNDQLTINSLKYEVNRVLDKYPMK